MVHIARHFDSQPGVTANSHLLLGDGSEMSLAEIEAKPLLFSHVDLLTLSACSTAFTNRTAGCQESPDLLQTQPLSILHADDQPPACGLSTPSGSSCVRNTPSLQAHAALYKDTEA